MKKFFVAIISAVMLFQTVTPVFAEGEETTEGEVQVKPDITQVKFWGNVQSVGWQEPVSNSGVVGTTGRTLALTALEFELPEAISSLGNIYIQPHVANVGWTDSVAQGTEASGYGNAIEAVKIWFDGELYSRYEIAYRAHVRNIGWMEWVKNGEIAGTTGRGLALEAIEIQIFERGTSSLGADQFSFKTHVKNIGWLGKSYNGNTSGTTGRALSVEALSFHLPDDMKAQGNMSIQAHVSNIGWQSPVGCDTNAGTTGRSLPIEALRISFTGELANQYDIYYRTHVSNIGWLGWTRNGEVAGTTGLSKPVEAIQIVYTVKNDPNAPGMSNSYLAQFTPTYFNQQDGRWADAYVGGYRFGSTGCVPTAIAMAINGILGNGVSPYDVGAWLNANTEEYNRVNHGGSGVATKYAAEAWGLHSDGMNSEWEISNALLQGKIVVLCVRFDKYRFSAPGGTHAIVLCKNSGGNTLVYDPWSSNKNGWYNIHELCNEFSNDPYDLRGGHVAYSVYY